MMLGAAGRGKENGTPSAAARSRATPAIDMASGRLGVISRSNTMSSRPRTVRMSSRSGDALHDEADPIEPVGEVEGRALDGGEVAEPGEWGLHVTPTRTASGTGRRSRRTT